MSTIQSQVQRIRPSAWWYLLVPVLLVSGVAFGIANGVDEGRRIADSFHGLGDDGSGTVELEAGDSPTVWAVWDDGRSSESVTRPPATVRITGPGGTPVAFDAREGSSETTWSVGSEAGVDLGTFTAPSAGRYDVAVTYEAGGVTGPVPTAAIGEVDLSGAVGSVVRPILQSLAAAIALTVILIVLRGRSKRRSTRDASGSAVEAAVRTDGRSGPFV